MKNQSGVDAGGMQYQINPASYQSVFAVPAAVVDQYLRFAGAAQLKILLWALRNCPGGFDADAASKSLKLSRMDVVDAAQYWVEAGILLRIGEESTGTDHQYALAPAAAETEAVQEKNVQPLAPAKPLSEDIVRRTQESPEIAFLFRQAQKKLGRTIGYDSQAKLLMMHDQYGLPVEVVLMIVEYCVSRGKGSIHYIEKMAMNWAEREIDTIESAEREIDYLNRTNTVWSSLRALTGQGNPYPTTQQQQFLNEWTQQLGFDVDMIYFAYEKTVDKTGKTSFAYMNKILQSWSREGLRTRAQVEQADAERRRQAASPAKSKKVEASGFGISYNLDKFEKKAAKPPVYHKKSRGS